MTSEHDTTLLIDRLVCLAERFAAEGGADLNDLQITAPPPLLVAVQLLRILQAEPGDNKAGICILENMMAVGNKQGQARLEQALVIEAYRHIVMGGDPAVLRDRLNEFDASLET
jgi:hypothetical protein